MKKQKKLKTKDKLKYPGLPRHLDKRIKLTREQIKSIRKLYKEPEWSQTKLAKEFGVSRPAIAYWIADKNKRKKLNKKRYARIKELEATDEEYARKRRKRKIKDNYSVIMRTQKLRKYKAKMTYRWKKKEMIIGRGGR